MARLLALLLLLAFPAARAQTAADYDALVSKMHDYGLFDGAVLVAEGNTVVFQKGYGEADRAWDVPVTPDTRFRIGSITKQFTAALILQLVEEGRVALDAPLTTYLPDYPADPGDRVTVHHLLTHTSGIPSYTGLPGFMQAESRNPYTPAELTAVFSGLPQEFEPGTAYRYNNSGYILLGAIIEAVTGQPYDRVLREQLLTPLGLDDTGYEHNADVVERMAHGYTRTGTRYANAPYLDTTVPYAAGMMYATVGDLHRWTRALHAGRPFQRSATLQTMLTPFLDGYALGIGVGKEAMGEDSVRVVQHGGGIHGFTAMLAYYPERDVTVAVLDNTSGGSGAVADALAALAHGQPAPEVKRPIDIALAAWIEERGLDAAVAEYRRLRAAGNTEYDFAEHPLNRLGYVYLGRGDTETAIAVFELNVETHPEASNPYDSLGEAYLAAGDTTRGLANYQKSLELNPGNENARRILAERGVEVQEPDVAVPEATLAAYVGRYQMQPGVFLTVTREGPQLSAQLTGQSAFAIYPRSETEFYLTVVPATLTFTRTGDGPAVSVTLRQNGRTIEMPRMAE